VTPLCAWQPHSVINLDTDRKERNAYDFPFIHSWVLAHVGKLLADFQESVKCEPLIPVGAPIDYVPKRTKRIVAPPELHEGGFD
jgi:hypothetical protein